MCFLVSAALLFCSVSNDQPSMQFAGQQPVPETVLADTRGAALTHGWLAATLTEQAVTQEQLVGETMRNGTDNWFADTNIQLIANAVIRGG